MLLKTPSSNIEAKIWLLFISFSTTFFKCVYSGGSEYQTSTATDPVCLLVVLFSSHDLNTQPEFRHFICHFSHSSKGVMSYWILKQNSYQSDVGLGIQMASLLKSQTWNFQYSNVLGFSVSRIPIPTVLIFALNVELSGWM